MNYCILVLCFLLCSYVVLIAYVAKHWQQHNVNRTATSDLPLVSVIIAARNEAQNIQVCLDSLLNNDYPHDKVEVLVIDDHSTDNTLDIIRSFKDPKIHCVNLQSLDISGSKKQALAYAATLAKGEIWMYTDADSIIPADWISMAVTRFSQGEKVDILLGPVGLTTVESNLQIWQYLDTIGMMAVTNAGVQSKFWHLANGANLAIRRKVWSIAGYPLNQPHKYASGDDVSLVQTYAKQFPNQIAFMAHQSYTVLTAGQQTLTDLVNQRLRWATKNKSYSNAMLKIIMGIPFLLSVTCFILVLSTIWQIEYGILGLAGVSIKGIVDTIYLVKVQRSFSHQIKPITICFHSMLHTLYIAIFGLASFLPLKYHWKGRKVK